MNPIKKFERVRIPFGKPLPVPKNAKQVFLNTYGNIRAEVDSGYFTIQTKKHKGNQREIVRINTNVTPATIELVIEEIHK
jgi:phage antirepressor YoqD-like protein